MLLILSNNVGESCVFGRCGLGFGVLILNNQFLLLLLYRATRQSKMYRNYLVKHDMKPAVYFLPVTKQLHQSQGFFIAAITNAMRYFGIRYFTISINIKFNGNTALHVVVKRFIGVAQIRAHKLIQCFFAAGINGLL